jgi:hypothetical protein
MVGHGISSGLSQKLLALGIKNVGALLLQLLEVSPVDLEPRVLRQESCDHVRRDGEDLGLDPRGGGGQVGQDAPQRLAHALRARLASVLVTPHACVGAEALGLHSHREHEIESLSQGLCVRSQTPLVGVERADLGLELAEGRLPRLVGGVDLR